MLRVAVGCVALILALSGCGSSSESRKRADRESTEEAWWTSPEADWVQQVAEHAGYRIAGGTGSALIARGNGWSFFIWATQGEPEEIARAEKRERWQTIDTVEGVEVYGDESLWRWWVTEGYVIWLQAGPRRDSELVPLSEMGPLVRASETVPPPPR